MEDDLIAIVAINSQYQYGVNGEVYILGVLTGLGVAAKVIEWGLFRLDHNTLGDLMRGEYSIHSETELIRVLNGGCDLAETKKSFDKSIMAGEIDLSDRDKRKSFFQGFNAGLSYLINFAWHLKGNNRVLAQTESKRWAETLKIYIQTNYLSDITSVS